MRIEIEDIATWLKAPGRYFIPSSIEKVVIKLMVQGGERRTDAAVTVTLAD